MNSRADADDEAPTQAVSPPGCDGLSGGLAAGQQIGPFRIEALLGRGGMGEVFRAQQIEPVQRVWLTWPPPPPPVTARVYYGGFEPFPDQECIVVNHANCPP